MAVALRPGNTVVLRWERTGVCFGGAAVGICEGGIMESQSGGPAVRVATWSLESARRVAAEVGVLHLLSSVQGNARLTTGDLAEEVERLRAEP